MADTSVTCPKCRRIFSAQAWHAGAQVACPNCGTKMGPSVKLGSGPLPTPDPHPPEVVEALKSRDSSLGRFVLVNIIGNGAMGKVWRGWDTLLRRWVAVKVMTFKTVSMEDLARFRREAKVAAQMEHPNIAPVYDLGESEGRHYIVMKLIEGMTLDRAFFQPGAPADPRDVVAAVRDAARGVGFAHARNAIHRDLKPTNIMLDTGKIVYVMDFGLAKSMHSVGITVAGARLILGTPGYMAPEAATGMVETVDIRSDVFSLGATLYALLTGRLIFSGTAPMDILQHSLKDAIPRVRALRPDLPAPLDEVLARATSRDKAARHADGGAFAEALDGVLAGWAAPAAGATRRVRRALVATQDPVLGALLQVCLTDLQLSAHLVRDVASLENSARVAGATIVIVDGRLGDGEALRSIARLRQIPGMEKVPVAVAGDEAAGSAPLPVIRCAAS